MIILSISMLHTKEYMDKCVNGFSVKDDIFGFTNFPTKCLL